MFTPHLISLNGCPKGRHQRGPQDNGSLFQSIPAGTGTPAPAG
jgi:hypothetical protein